MSTIQEYYRERYRHLGHASGPATEPTFALRVNAALKLMSDTPQRVLDYGCNIGAAASIFADAGHQVIGLDISHSAIAVAQSRASRAAFKVVDSERQIPLPDASVDVCFCSEVIEHLFAVPEFIEEVFRVLAPGGQFLLTTPYHGWIKNLIIICRNFDSHFDPSGGHIRFFSQRSLTACLQAGGFQVENITGIGRCWPIWKSMFVAARKA